MEYPLWWNWEIEISTHILNRMLNRNFNEIDLRTMLETAKGYVDDYEEGRFVIASKMKKKDWEIIVEPDYIEKVLVVITAYPKEC